MSTPFELVNAHACFGGAQRYYQHDSREIGLGHEVLGLPAAPGHHG